MSTLGELVVSLTADTGKFTSEMSKAAKNSQTFSSKIGTALAGIGKVAIGAAVGGIAALGAGLVYATKEAMEAQEVQAQLNAVLESTGGIAGVTADMANNLADKYSKLTRFGDEAILSGENILLTFTNIGKDIFPQATETMLNMSQALGQDLQSSAVQLGKALQDPILGVSALRRVGVNFSEDQQQVIADLVNTGRAAEAQAMILQELQVEFGGSAEAAGQTFAGQLDILKNSLGNVAEGIGMALLPALTGIVSGITPIINEYGPKLAEWFSANLPIAIQALSDMWTGTLQPALATVWAFILNSVIPILQDIYAWLSVNVPAAIAVLGEWLGTLRAWWQEHGGAIMAKAKEIWDTIISAITAFINWASPAISGFLAAIKGFWDDHGAQIIAAVQGMWDGVKLVWETFKAAWANLVALFHLAQEGKWREFGEKIREILDAAWEAIKEAAGKAIQAIKDFFTETDWGAVGEGILKGIGNGITAGLEWLKDAAIAAAKAALEAAKGFLGIDSPSKVFAEVGKNMMLGMAQGIMQSSKMPELAMVGVASRSVQAAGDVKNYYNLTINEAGQRGNVVMDFALLQALSRG